MRWDIDDIVVWPNGTVATVAEVRAGHYSWMSDDFEIVRQDNLARLRELGIDDLSDITG